MKWGGHPGEAGWEAGRHVGKGEGSVGTQRRWGITGRMTPGCPPLPARCAPRSMLPRLLQLQVLRTRHADPAGGREPGNGREATLTLTLSCSSRLKLRASWSWTSSSGPQDGGWGRECEGRERVSWSHSQKGRPERDKGPTRATGPQSGERPAETQKGSGAGQLQREGRAQRTRRARDSSTRRAEAVEGEAWRQDGRT